MALSINHGAAAMILVIAVSGAGPSARHDISAQVVEHPDLVAEFAAARDVAQCEVLNTWIPTLSRSVIPAQERLIALEKARGRYCGRNCAGLTGSAIDTCAMANESCSEEARLTAADDETLGAVVSEVASRGASRECAARRLSERAGLTLQEVLVFRDVLFDLFLECTPSLREGSGSCGVVRRHYNVSLERALAADLGRCRQRTHELNAVAATRRSQSPHESFRAWLNGRNAVWTLFLLEANPGAGLFGWQDFSAPPSAFARMLDTWTLARRREWPGCTP